MLFPLARGSSIKHGNKCHLSGIQLVSVGTEQDGGPDRLSAAGNHPPINCTAGVRLCCGDREAASVPCINTDRLGTRIRQPIGQCWWQHAAKAVLRPLLLHLILWWWELNRYSSSVKHHTAAQLCSRSPLTTKNRVTDWRVPTTDAQNCAASFKEHHSLFLGYTVASKLHGPTFLLRRSPDGSPSLGDDEYGDGVAAQSNIRSPLRNPQHYVGESSSLQNSSLLFHSSRSHRILQQRL